ncbi:MAG: ATP-binding protein [Rhodothermales bacterium]
MQPAFPFEQDSGRAGFRLARLEVFNWGTFHGRVWTVEPGGGTALLTGANGSGKSTLVDALLTLLVPNAKRGYNLASGAETKKKERDERSYVLGAYGKTKGDDAPQSQTRYLRTKDDYAVLLASFANESLGQRLTLAQVFYLRSGTLEKFFVGSPGTLRIAEDFAGFADVRELKGRLRDGGAEVFDQFNHYGAWFRRAFDLRSEQALDLFNQTVSIKVIGDLNTFVRTHMLEGGDAIRHIDDLRRHFDDLTRTYEAIQKAKDQLEKLRPIRKSGNLHEKLGAEAAELDACARAVPGYFAREETRLLEAALAKNARLMEQARQHLAGAEQRVEGLRKQERDLDVAISGDEAGRQLRELEQAIRRAGDERRHRRGRWEQYREPAEALGFTLPEGEVPFHQRRNEAEALQHQTDEDVRNLVPQRDALVKKCGRLGEDLAAGRDELDSLRQRTSQIPKEHLRLRQRLLDDLGLPEADLPFIGELLKVKEEEAEWEGAAERLLHGFALRLLVPERHYDRVSAYVNKTYLGGRLVYHKVPSDVRPRALRDADPARLYNKLDVRPSTTHAAWLRDELTERFDHVCGDLDAFRRERRAVTASGLIKQSRTLHEKDDRRALRDRRNYILGWDNRAKIQAIEMEVARMEEELGTLRAQQEEVEEAQRNLRTRQAHLADLLRFADFAEIDWQRTVREIQHLQDQQHRLEASADRLQTLRADRDRVREELAEAEREVKTHEKAITRLEDQSEQHTQRLGRCRDVLGAYTPAELDAYAEAIAALLQEPIRLETLADVRDRVREALNGKRQAKRDKQYEVASRIVRAMQRYKSDYPGETTDVDADVKALPDFRRFLETIEREDLPRHERRFRELLNRKLMEDMSFFENALFRQEEEIREKVEALNRSLRPIAYTPSTYIRLRTEAARDIEVQEFKHLLKSVFADNEGSTAAGEASFLRIKNLIDRFDHDERWTRKVTDVRQWLDFSVSERYLETDEEKSFITDSAGLSGGQKAKLAYTILASAIAYQFGLDYGRPHQQAFRFVVIDEAFSKIDEDNARYAMDLFRQLDLQLLVVSPLGSTRVVEDYITACHFVTNTAEGNDSQVRTLSIEEYHAEKARLVASLSAS